jgi:asparagine synthase (glutamine-hydrolysing)
MGENAGVPAALAPGSEFKPWSWAAYDRESPALLARRGSSVQISRMCGFGALIDPAGTTSDGVPAAMTAALRHRGPDGAGSYRRGPALLVHTRLAIIDVAGGDQPLMSEDGSCAVVVNGEIYNQLDLRAELESRGHRFATRSDSEVVVHAYEEWGLDSVRRLNGMFAFALWDDRRARLVAARDAFGVKPLYWWSDGRRVAVASEIGALLAAGLVTAELDPVALDHYLAWRFVPSPRTLFTGVSKLAPASTLVAERSHVEISSYRVPPDGAIDGASADELAAELKGRFVDAVHRQMMSDVPYGAFLSGGVDSAAIVAAMARSNEGPPLTFTIGFPGHGGQLDERDAAADTAAKLGADHHATGMTEHDFPAELARCIERLEEPCGAPSAPAAMQLSRFAVESVKVVLSGQGADEPLGGYERHQAAAVLPALERIPGWFQGPARRGAALVPRNERLKRAAYLLSAPVGIARLLAVFEIAPRQLRLELTGRPDAEAQAERLELAASVLADLPDRDDPLEQALYLDTHLFLPDSLLIYGDKMSMAVGLEQRVPFLDVELMRFVERLPGRLRVRWLTRKWLYRRAVHPLVPEPVLKRHKHPFATPYDRWLRSSLGDRVEWEFGSRPELAAVVDPAVVARLVAEHRSGRFDHKRVLYCLLELASWHGTFVERLPQLAGGRSQA